MMPRTIYFTDDAARDLKEIHDYISHNDGPQNADYVLGQIEAVVKSLSEFPHRGVYPPELIALDIREYRQVFFKPFRIIYQLMDNNVIIMLLADGRRDLQSLLLRRLLEA